MSGLKSAQFRKEREQNWLRLEDLLSRIDRHGIQSLYEFELLELPILYRNVLSSLSVARSISLDQNLEQYLESLTIRAYLQVYGVRQTFRQTAWHFFTEGFPKAFYQFRWYILLSTALFFLGAGLAFWMCLDDMENFYILMDASMMQGRDPLATTEYLRSTLYDKIEQEDELFFFASYLFTHNSGVGILSFVTGIFGGFPTFYLIFENGLNLGAFVALFASRGLMVDVLGWLLPHGITEIFALILCGASGLVLGFSVLLPGKYSRLVNLRRAGRAAIPLITGSVCMLLLAGIIEGFFRQMVTDIMLRYSLASITAFFWLGYFSLGWRKDS